MWSRFSYLRSMDYQSTQWVVQDNGFFFALLVTIPPSLEDGDQDFLNEVVRRHLEWHLGRIVTFKGNTSRVRKQSGNSAQPAIIEAADAFGIGISHFEITNTWPIWNHWPVYSHCVVIPCNGNYMNLRRSRRFFRAFEISVPFGHILIVHPSFSFHLQ